MDRNSPKAQYDLLAPGPSRFLASYFGGGAESPTLAVHGLSVVDGVW